MGATAAQKKWGGLDARNFWSHSLFFDGISFGSRFLVLWG
jgi:hypothetical protein